MCAGGSNEGGTKLKHGTKLTLSACLCACHPQVLKELELLEDDAQVFKLIGPVLVKQVRKGGGPP